MQAIIILAGAAMTASGFMAWVTLPFAGSFVPVDALRDMLGPDAAWEIWAFALSFVVAGLTVVLAVTGRPAARDVAILAGAAPFALLAWVYTQADQRLAEVNLQIPGVSLQDTAQVWDAMGQYVQPGLWVYFGAAGLLILAGLFGRGRGAA